MLHQRNALAALIAAIIFSLSLSLSLVAVSNAGADTPADTSARANVILTNVAEHVSHGFANYNDSFETMEAKIARGEHISVLCGQVSYLGARALGRAGITVRFVGAFASQRADLLDVPSDVIESHAMLEVWTGARWELYDLDSNVQPVDSQGQPVTIGEFVNMPVRYFRTLATDPLYDPTNDQYPAYESWVFSNHDAWYDRVLDIPTIYQNGHYIYVGPQDSVLSGMAGYYNVTQQAFDTWAAEAPQTAATATPAPAAAPVAPAAPAAASVAPVAVASPAAAYPQPKPKPKRTFVTRVKHGKVYRVYGKGRTARWVFVRRAR